jgi:hypothetical protein
MIRPALYDTRLMVELGGGLVVFAADALNSLDLFLADVAATEREARRVLLHDLILKPHQSVEQRFGSRGTARNVNINRHYAIHPLQGRVGRERPSGRSARAHRDAPFRLRHLIPNALDDRGHL